MAMPLIYARKQVAKFLKASRLIRSAMEYTLYGARLFAGRSLMP